MISSNVAILTVEELKQMNTERWNAGVTRGRHEKVTELGPEIKSLREENSRLKAVLRRHHDWHNQENLEVVIHNQRYLASSIYIDSTLERETSDALGVRLGCAE